MDPMNIINGGIEYHAHFVIIPQVSWSSDVIKVFVSEEQCGLSSSPEDALEGFIRGWPLNGLPNSNGATYVGGGTVNG